MSGEEMVVSASSKFGLFTLEGLMNYLYCLFLRACRGRARSQAATVLAEADTNPEMIQ